MELVSVLAKNCGTDLAWEVGLQRKLSGDSFAAYLDKFVRIYA